MTPHDSSLSSETMCLETVPSLTLGLAGWLSLADGIITEVKKQRLAECALRWGLTAHFPLEAWEALWGKTEWREKRRRATTAGETKQRVKPSALVCGGYSHKSPQTEWLNINVLFFIAAGQRVNECLLGLKSRWWQDYAIFLEALAGRFCFLAHLFWQSSRSLQF